MKALSRTSAVVSPSYDVDALLDTAELAWDTFSTLAEEAWTSLEDLANSPPQTAAEGFAQGVAAGLAVGVVTSQLDSPAPGLADVVAVAGGLGLAAAGTAIGVYNGLRNTAWNDRIDLTLPGLPAVGPTPPAPPPTPPDAVPTPTTPPAPPPEEPRPPPTR